MVYAALNCCWEGLVQGPVWGCSSPVCVSACVFCSVKQCFNMPTEQCTKLPFNIVRGFHQRGKSGGGEGDGCLCPLWNCTCHAFHPKTADISETDTLTELLETACICVKKCCCVVYKVWFGPHKLLPQL